MWEGLHGQHIQIRADEPETATGYANYGFSVHLTRFSTEVDFRSCDVRLGSLADFNACSENGLLSGVKRTKINGLQNVRS